MEQFPSNRHKDRTQPSQPEEKKVERVIHGEVVRRKRSLGKRFLETFGGGDAKSVWGYVMFDVLVPGARDMVHDVLSSAVYGMIYGGENRSQRRIVAQRQSGGPTVSYHRMSKDPRERDQQMSRRARAAHDFDEIVLATRVEGEEVIDRLYDLINKYEMATVSDLYELVGLNGSYTDNKWGWTALPNAGVSRTRTGYLLNLPRPEPL